MAISDKTRHERHPTDPLPRNAQATGMAVMHTVAPLVAYTHMHRVARRRRSSLRHRQAYLRRLRGTLAGWQFDTGTLTQAI